MTARLRAALFLALATAPAACGGGDGGPGLAFADSVSSADAHDFGEGVAGYATQLSRTMNFNEPSISTTAGAMQARVARMLTPIPGAFAARAVAAPDLSLLDWHDRPARARGLALANSEGCTTHIRGSLDPWGDVPVDDNDNGIPDDFAITLTCIAIDTLATDSVVTETTDRVIAYREIGGSLYGMTVHLVDRYRVGDNHGHYHQFRSEANGTLDIRSPKLIDQASLVSREEATVGDAVVFQEGGETWDNVFTPSGTITGVNNRLPAGDLFINGRRYRADSDGNNVAFVISTLVPLKYYTPCVAADSFPPFTAGSVRGELNGRSTQGFFELGFVGCGTYVVSTDSTFDAAALR